MECPECQFDNRVGVKFCEECGAKFGLECPICKAKIPSEYSFKHALELSNKHDEKWIEGTSRIYLGSTIAQNDESNIKQNPSPLTSF